MSSPDKDKIVAEDENSVDIEQITKIPKPRKVEKIKDPKKIAAGKKLAEYNKKARDKTAQREKLNQVEDEGPTDSFLPATSFTSIIALLGLGLTAIDLFLRYKTSRNNENRQKDVDYALARDKILKSTDYSNDPPTDYSYEPTIMEERQYGME